MQFLSYVNNLRTLVSQIDWLDLDDLASLFKVRLQTVANLTANRTVSFPDASGTVYLQGQTLASAGNAVQAYTNRPTVSVTASRNVLATDNGCRLDCTNSGSVVLTVQPNSTVPMPVGSIVDIKRRGGGTVGITPGAGVTFQGDPSGTALSGNQNVQYQVVLVKTGADQWSLEFFLPNNGTLPGNWSVGNMTISGNATVTGTLAGTSNAGVSARVYPTVVSVTGSKTLGLSDNGTVQDCTNTADAGITVPTNAVAALPVGSVIKINRRTSRLVTLTKSAGVTFRVNGLGTPSSVTSYDVARDVSIRKTATDTWDLEFARPRPVKYLLIMAGEGNSGGGASTAGLPSNDLLAYPEIQIWNNTSSVFQALQVGVNNLIGHTGLTNNASIGLERGLMRDMGRLGLSNVYLLKSGQGGSTIAQWLTADASGYFTTFQTRFLAARAAIEAQGFEVQPVLIWWQGTSDAAAGTLAATWRTTTNTVLGQFRALIGANAPVFMYRLMTVAPNAATRTALNAEITTLAAADANLYPVTVSSSAELLGDGTTYSAQGFVSAWNAFADEFLARLGAYQSTSAGIVRNDTANRPIVMAHNTGGSSVANGAAATVPLVSAFDLDGCFSNNAFTVPSWGAGTYFVSWHVGFDQLCSQAYSRVLVNGAFRLAAPTLLVTGTDFVLSSGGSGLLTLSAGDQVTLDMFQSNASSAVRATDSTVENRARLHIYRVTI